MTILSLNDISVSFGPEDILGGITCAINAGDRIGLVGRNGAGKTSLLRVLAGRARPVGGQRHAAKRIRLHLVEQLPPDVGAGTVVDSARQALSDVIEIERQLKVAAVRLAAGDPHAPASYSELEDRFRAMDGYSYESRIEEVLCGLGFSVGEWDRSVAVLSGGERSRLALAQALLADPDLLLMDEPTNHLDLDGLRWLEGFLGRWRGSLVVASHDRHFLDIVANRIWHLASGRLTSYAGNYSKFEELQAAALERQRREFEAQQEFITKEEAFIQRYRAGRKAREAKGREKRLARLEKVEDVAKEKRLTLKLHATRTGEVVLRLEGLQVGYDGRCLLAVDDVEVERGSRIAVVGPNGTGKSTLLKTIAGELPAVGGRVSLGAGVRLALHRQEPESGDTGATVFDMFVRSTGLDYQQARDVLGAFLFSGDEVAKPVAALSGGERSRLALAQLVSSGANLLLLDEPTNHLDIPGREALEAALEAYKGTFLFVSHDRRLIARLASEVWTIEGGAIRRMASLEEPEREPKPRPRPRAARPAVPVARRTVAPDRSSLEDEALALEDKLADLGEQINAASLKGDISEVRELGARYQEVSDRLEEVMASWSATSV